MHKILDDKDKGKEKALSGDGDGDNPAPIVPSVSHYYDELYDIFGESLATFLGSDLQHGNELMLTLV